MTKLELLDNGPAADYLGVEEHTLEIWRSTGRYRIPYIKVGRRVKYRRDISTRGWQRAPSALRKRKDEPISVANAHLTSAITRNSLIAMCTFCAMKNERVVERLAGEGRNEARQVSGRR